MQPAGKDRQLLCCDCRAYLKKTNELPPLTSQTGVSGTPSTPSKDPGGKDAGVNKDPSAKDASSGKETSRNDKDSKEPAYLFRPVADSPDASPQRMRTRNKAAKEQSSNRARPKRGGNTRRLLKLANRQCFASQVTKLPNLKLQ